MNEGLHLGDCGEGMRDIPDGAVDLILTDPPYTRDLYREAFGILAREAPRVLKPSGFLVTYSAHYFLPEVMNLLGTDLLFYWLLIQQNRAPRPRAWNRNLTITYKPILVYQRPPEKKQAYFGTDTLPRAHMEKRYHRWQQAIKEALYLVKLFTTGGEDLVLDPFAGSGTSLLAAKLLGRRWVGFERDPVAHGVAMERLTQTALGGWAGEVEG